MGATLHAMKAARDPDLGHANGHWTYATALAELPETNQPTEIWHGRLIMAPAPLPIHQIISSRIQDALRRWVTRHRLGLVLYAPVDVVLTPKLVVQPDVLFISKARMHLIKEHVKGAPDLVVEIVSPDRRKRDYKDKKDQYEAHGVREYWIIDPDKEHIEVWFLNEESFFEAAGRFVGKQHAVSKLLTGFKVQVNKILENPLRG
jgi:Uma2 family endonuclease